MKLYEIYEDGVLIYNDLDETTKDDFVEHVQEGAVWEIKEQHGKTT